MGTLVESIFNMRAFFVLAFVVATVAAQCNDTTTGCPACGDDELTCMDMALGAEACPICIPNQDGTEDNWGNPCPVHCPVSCLEGERLCGVGVDPWSGCMMPGWCEPAEDHDGRPRTCPITCGQDEIHCSGGMDPTTSCPMPDICIPSQDGTEDNWGNPCWNSCPMTCHEGEQVCGAGIDPWTGCNNPGWCEQAMDHDGCPRSCPMSCGQDEMHCSGGMDPTTGCMMPEICVPNQDGTEDNWGNPCWNSCPVFCHEGEQVCGGGVDPWSGCVHAGWCEQTMVGDCPRACPVNCGPGEMHCWGGLDENNCNLPDYCVAEGPKCGM